MSEGPDLSVVYSGAVDKVLASADRSPTPRSLDVIYELAQASGVGTHSVVVDAGCGTGDRSRELIRRTGCRVDGVELLPQLIAWGTAETTAAGLDDQLRLHRGSILDLPLPDGHADVVLCADVFGLVGDLPLAVAECGRVLKPSGMMVSHVTVATNRMAAFEQAELDDGQGTVGASMNQANLEQAFSSHFTVVQKVDLGGQHRQHAIETGDDETLTNLVRASRLMTWPHIYRAEHGELAYRAALTEALWGTYQLLGKLSPVVYLLRRRPGPPG